MKKHTPPARSTGKRSLKPPGRQARARTKPSAATATVQGNTEFQRVVHELQVHQEELEAQNEELRETQQQLEASRDRYADLYDFAPIGYATLDGNGHIREINLTGATILGRERSRLLGTLFSVAVAKDDLNAFHAHLRKCEQGRGPVTTELTLAMRDRDPVPVQLYSVAILDLAGLATMYRTAITDITERKQAETILRLAHDQLEDRVRERTAELAGAVEGLQKEVSDRKRAEEALQESEQGQRMLFESAPDTIIVADADGRIVQANQQTEAMFGYHRSELIGQPVETLIPERFRDSHVRDRAVYMGTPHVRPMGVGLQLHGRHKDGSEFPVDIVLSPLVAKRGTTVIAVVRDVTERKRREETLRELSVHLLQTQDEERRRIARELHDSTGQKLAALAMNLSLIGKSAKTLDARTRKALTESLALLDRSSRDIRTLSYLLHPPLLDERGLAAAVRWFADGFAERSGVQVKLEMAPDLPRLPEQIEVALFRIVQEGLTNIDRHSGSSTATIRLMVDQQQVQLEMRDTGKGFPKPRSDGSVTPLGVGITGMRERVKQLGGQMKMESGSRGTTVSGDPASYQTGVMSVLRILIADDHEVVRAGVRSLLESEPHCEICGEAVTGRQVVALAQQLKPDVAILDITMPELNGLEATRQIREVAPTVQVLILSVHESEDLVREIIDAGAHGYILKSDAGRELTAAMEALRKHETFFTSRVAQIALRAYRNKKTTVDAPLPSGGGLTPREREVLQLLAEGKSNKGVASALGISVMTVETHRYNIMHKLGVHSVAELVHYAVRQKIITP